MEKKHPENDDMQSPSNGAHKYKSDFEFDDYDEFEDSPDVDTINVGEVETPEDVDTDSRELEIQGKNSPTIKVTQHQKVFNMIEATSEEVGEMLWKPQVKETNSPITANIPQGGALNSEPSIKAAGLAPEPESEKKARPIKPRERERSRSTGRYKAPVKKHPMHYYMIYYGAIILVIMTLIILSLWKIFGTTTPQNEVEQLELKDPRSIWLRADDLSRESEVEFLGAMDIKEQYIRAKNDLIKKNLRDKLLKKLDKAEKLMEGAVNKGTESLQIQSQIVQKESGISAEEALTLTKQKYSKYWRYIQDWSTKKQRITKQIEELKQ